MKSLDKLKVIENKIDILNSTVLRNKDFKLSYDNKGANNYCISLRGNSFSFATYGSVISSLDLLITLFKKEEERNVKSNSNRRKNN